MAKIIRNLIKKIPGARRLYFKTQYKRYLQELRKQSPVGTGRKVLIINHHFDQDIEALTVGCSSSFQFFAVKCMPFFNQGLLFFKTREERDGIIPYDKLPKDVTQGYRKVCAQLFADLHAIFPFEMILIPSDVFWWAREFLEVARERGVKRIVLDKEGTVPPYYSDLQAIRIKEKFPFISDYLLVWSERQKQFWRKAGATENCIKIVGQPRSDFFFQKSRWLSRKDLKLDGFKKHLLYFTFDINAYIDIYPQEEIKREGYSWLPLRNALNQALLSFARDNRDICVTIKAHPQQADIIYMREFVKKSGLPNMRLAEGAALSNQLIVNADLIVGFQTTALIEAMLTDKPILYPMWGETEKKVREYLIPFHSTGGVEKIISPEQFKDKLTRWLRNESLGGDLQQRKRFTDYWLEADGKVASRITKELKVISQS